MKIPVENIEYSVGTCDRNYWGHSNNYRVIRHRDKYIICNVEPNGNAKLAGDVNFSIHPQTPEGLKRAISLCLYAATGIAFIGNSGKGHGPLSDMDYLDV